MRLQNADIGMPKHPTIAGRVIEAAVYALLTVFFICVGFISAFGALDTITATIKALGVLLLLLAVFYALCRFESRSRELVVGILALAALLRIGYIFAVPTQPTSDFALLYNVARSTANEDVSWMNVTEGYFSWWQYQIPFVLYEAAIIKLTHSVVALKLLNVVWSVGIVYMVYCIAGLYMPRRASLIAAALCAVYPGHILMSSVLTNQHISLFFILLGVYVCLKADSLLKYAVAGLLLAVGDMMRPEAGIVVAAIGCAGLARDAVTRQSNDRGTAPILTAAIMCGTVVAYLLVEIQPRYRFFAIPFILMLAAYPFKIKIQHKK